MPNGNDKLKLPAGGRMGGEAERPAGDIQTEAVPEWREIVEKLSPEDTVNLKRWEEDFAAARTERKKEELIQGLEGIHPQLPLALLVRNIETAGAGRTETEPAPGAPGRQSAGQAVESVAEGAGAGGAGQPPQPPRRPEGLPPAEPPPPPPPETPPPEPPEGPRGPEESPIERMRRLGAHIDHYEEIEIEVPNLEHPEGPPIRERVRMPIYRDATVEMCVELVRDYLDRQIMSDAMIQLGLPDHRNYFGLVWTARNLAARSAREEDRRRAEDLAMEFEAIRRALDWYHLGARSLRGEADMTSGKETFTKSIAYGNLFTGDYIKWLAESYRGQAFKRGFGIAIEDASGKARRLQVTDYQSPSEYLGAQLRLSSGAASKDGNARELFTYVGGQKIAIINGTGEPSYYSRPQNKNLYEQHKTLNFDAYALGYREVRHEILRLGYEFSHIIQDPDDPRRRIPVFICHLSPERALLYNAFQHPKHMAKFWYRNLDHLPPEFRKQLGWREDLTDEQNKALLGRADDFLNLPLEQRLAMGWNAGKSDEENLIALGLMRKWGDMEFKDYFTMTKNLINLETSDIPSEIWQVLDWSDIDKVLHLGDTAQQWYYMANYVRNPLINLLLGKEIMQSLEVLRSGMAYSHVPEILGYIAQRERNYWDDAFSLSFELPTRRAQREKGNRSNLASEIRSRLGQGLYRGFLRTVEFSAVGFNQADWTKGTELLSRPEFAWVKIRQLLQNMSEVKIIRDGICQQAGITFEELISYAGLKIKRHHFEEILFECERETEIEDRRAWQEYQRLATDEQRKEWARNNPLRAERILHHWIEFEEMTRDEWQQWGENNEEARTKIYDWMNRWPGRFGWVGLERGELDVGVWRAALAYLKPKYQDNPNLPKRKYGPRWDTWQEWQRLCRIVRRQKYSMDFRQPFERNLEREEYTGVPDTIVGKFIHDQMEWRWDPDAGSYQLIIYDQPGDELRGLNRLNALEMSAGEYWPGDPQEVSGPLWYGHNMELIVLRYFARNLWGYKIKQAELAALARGMSVNDYWRRYHIYREIMTPEKMYAIFRILRLTGAIDPNEVDDYLNWYGCTWEQMVAHRTERRQLAIPDAEWNVTTDMAPELQQAVATFRQELGAIPGASLLNLITGGRTRTEMARIISRGLLGTSLPVLINNIATMVFRYHIPILDRWALGIGLVLGLSTSLAAIDRGDLVRGAGYVLPKLAGGMLVDREKRSSPEAFQRGHAVGLFGSIPQKWIPPVSDDEVVAKDIIEPIIFSRAQLGGEGVEK